MSETRAANGFSQAYIFMILIPDTTSFIMRILLSVRVAVLLLKTKNIYYKTDITVVEIYRYCSKVNFRIFASMDFHEHITKNYSKSSKHAIACCSLFKDDT